MIAANTEELIKEIFISVSDKSQIARIEKSYANGEDLSFEDLNLDSLKAVEALMAVEEKVGVDVDLEEFDEVPTIHKFVEYCKQRLSEDV